MDLKALKFILKDEYKISTYIVQNEQFNNIGHTYIPTYVGRSKHNVWDTFK